MDDETLVGISPKHLRAIRRLLHDYLVLANITGSHLSIEDVMGLRSIDGLISGILGDDE
jgi:hypothetical protein